MHYTQSNIVLFEDAISCLVLYVIFEEENMAYIPRVTFTGPQFSLWEAAYAPISRGYSINCAHKKSWNI